MLHFHTQPAFSEGRKEASCVSWASTARSMSARMLLNAASEIAGLLRSAGARTFLSGIDHLIYHGTAYSPPDAAYSKWWAGSRALETR